MRNVQQVSTVTPIRPLLRREKSTRLTATRVHSLSCGHRQRDVSDPEKRGLVLRLEPSGSKTYLFRYKWRGQQVRLSIGPHPQWKLAEARDQADEFRKLLKQGIDPRAGRRPRLPPVPSVGTDGEAADPHSVKALAAEFMLRFVTPNRKRPEYVKRILDVEVLSRWPKRDARSIKPRDVIELLDAIVDRGARTTANRTAAILSQMFRFGIQRQTVESSPVQLLYKPGGKERPRNRALDDGELAALLASLDEVMARAPQTASATRIALHTACRRSELGLARWRDVTLDGNAPLWRIPAENSKTGVECLVPLAPAAIAEFRQLKKRADRSQWVFPAASGNGAADPKLLTRSLARHMKALAKHKVAAFTIHDLRRTVRTGLARLKVPPHIAERVLNHAQPGIVATYDVHAYVDEKREALEQWAAHLTSLEK
ncbi:MAG TPA: integrase arm-type DNA-binding domain-containing protein [Solirubrobacteraceae bacterium]|nr:integrase arm-type DNA-binding domain-containing protein [Solirubrobacteraceae bacterium]